jgi:hypothetical protein
VNGIHWVRCLMLSAISAPFVIVVALVVSQ